MAEVEKQFIQQTRNIWQLHTDHVLTDEDARQIIENAVGFFEVLREWDIRERDQEMS